MLEREKIGVAAKRVGVISFIAGSLTILGGSSEVAEVTKNIPLALSLDLAGSVAWFLGIVSAAVGEIMVNQPTREVRLERQRQAELKRIEQLKQVNEAFVDDPYKYN